MNRYSDKIVELFLDPKNSGKLEHPTGVGVAGRPGEGPFMVFQIICSDGIVTAAAFQSHTCGVTIACGSILTTLVLNRTLAECKQITAARIADALDGVPVDKLHVAEFALRAMWQAADESLK